MNTMYKSREEIFLKKLAENPSFAENYLREAQQDGEVDVIIMAIRQILQANRWIAKLAEDAEMSRPSLYKWLNFESTPSSKTLEKAINFITTQLWEKGFDDMLYHAEIEIRRQQSNTCSWGNKTQTSTTTTEELEAAA